MKIAASQVDGEGGGRREILDLGRVTQGLSQCGAPQGLDLVSALIAGEDDPRLDGGNADRTRPDAGDHGSTSVGREQQLQPLVGVNVGAHDAPGRTLEMSGGGQASGPLQGSVLLGFKSLPVGVERLLEGSRTVKAHVLDRPKAVKTAAGEKAKLVSIQHHEGVLGGGPVAPDGRKALGLDLHLTSDGTSGGHEGPGTGATEMGSGDLPGA